VIPSHPVSTWQYFDLISISAIFIILLILTLNHYRNTGLLEATVSQTVAYSKNSSLIFSIAVTPFFPLYYGFLYFWVAPLTNMPKYFYYLLILSALCELIFVWVPATNGRKKKVHGIMAGFVGIVMLIAPFLFLTQGTNLRVESKALILGFYILTLALGISLISKKAREYLILCESTYCLGFLVVMSVIAHT